MFVGGAMPKWAVSTSVVRPPYSAAFFSRRASLSACLQNLQHSRRPHQLRAPAARRSIVLCTLILVCVIASRDATVAATHHARGSGEVPVASPSVLLPAGKAAEVPADARNFGETAPWIPKDGSTAPVAAVAAKNETALLSGASTAAATGSSLLPVGASALLLKGRPVDLLAADVRNNQPLFSAPPAEKHLALLRAAPPAVAAVQQASSRRVSIATPKKDRNAQGRCLYPLAAAAPAAGASSPAVTPTSNFRQANTPAAASAAASALVGTVAVEAAAGAPAPAAPLTSAEALETDVHSGTVKTRVMPLRSIVQPEEVQDSDEGRYPASWYEESTGVPATERAVGTESPVDTESAAVTESVVRTTTLRKNPLQRRRRQGASHRSSAGDDNSSLAAQGSVFDDVEEEGTGNYERAVAVSEHMCDGRSGRRGTSNLGRRGPSRFRQLLRQRGSDGVVLRGSLGGKEEMIMSLGLILSVVAFAVGVTLRSSMFHESPQGKNGCDSQQVDATTESTGDGIPHMLKTAAVPSHRRSDTATEERALFPDSSSTEVETTEVPAEDTSARYVGTVLLDRWKSSTSFERALFYIAVQLLVLWLARLESDITSPPEHAQPRCKEAGKAVGGEPTTGEAPQPPEGPGPTSTPHWEGAPCSQKPVSAEGGQKTVILSGWLQKVSQFVVHRLVAVETGLIVAAVLAISKGLLHLGRNRNASDNPPFLSSLQKTLGNFLIADQRPSVSSAAKPPLPTTRGEALTAAVKKTEEDVRDFVAEAIKAEVTRMTVAAQEELLGYIEDLKYEENPVKQALKIAAMRELIERLKIDQLQQDLDAIDEAAGESRHPMTASAQAGKRLDSISSGMSSLRRSRSTAGVSSVPPLTRQEKLYWSLEIAEHAHKATAWIDEERRILRLMSTTGDNLGSRSSRSRISSFALLYTVVPTSGGDFVERTVVDQYLALRRSYYLTYTPLTEGDIWNLDTFSLDPHDYISASRVRAHSRKDTPKSKRDADLRSIQALMRKHPQLAQLLPTHSFSWRLPLP